MIEVNTGQVSRREREWHVETALGLTQLIREAARQSGQDVRDESARVDHQHESGDGEHDQVEQEVSSLRARSGFRVGHGGRMRYKTKIGVMSMRWMEPVESWNAFGLFGLL